MVDKVDKETRSRMMSAVRGKNTKLEIDIRRLLFAQGFRYRIHAGNLPGKPDMAFPKYSAAVFINGCFWHFHECMRSTVPQSRKEWWLNKLRKNQERDLKIRRNLLANNWRVLVVWECAVRRPGIDRGEALVATGNCIVDFLKSADKFREISGHSLEAAILQ